MERMVGIKGNGLQKHGLIQQKNKSLLELNNRIKEGACFKSKLSF